MQKRCQKIAPVLFFSVFVALLRKIPRKSNNNMLFLWMLCPIEESEYLSVYLLNALRVGIPEFW